MTTGRILKINEVKAIQKLLEEGASIQTISFVIGVSETTVKRIKNGTHYLLREKKEEPKKEVDNKPTKQEIVKIYGDKLIQIIDLLKELTDMTVNQEDKR